MSKSLGEKDRFLSEKVRQERKFDAVKERLGIEEFRPKEGLLPTAEQLEIQDRMSHLSEPVEEPDEEFQYLPILLEVDGSIQEIPLYIKGLSLILKWGIYRASLWQNEHKWWGDLYGNYHKVGRITLWYWRTVVAEGLVGTANDGTLDMVLRIFDIKHQFPLVWIPECLRVGLPEGSRIGL